jgi:hypothetical protein
VGGRDTTSIMSRYMHLYVGTPGQGGRVERANSRRWGGEGVSLIALELAHIRGWFRCGGRVKNVRLCFALLVEHAP